MKCPVYIVFTLTRNIYTKAITEVTMLNCFATLPQAKASLQYEYDIAIAEHCNPLDETDRPVWLNDDHTELKLAPGYDPSYETVVYIDSSVHFHDINEPCFDYHNDDGLPVVNHANTCEPATPVVDESVDKMYLETNFRLLDSVCFGCELTSGFEVIRGRLIGVSIAENDNGKYLVGTVDRMVIESTGKSFDSVSIRRNMPLSELYHNPADVISARER